MQQSRLDWPPTSDDDDASGWVAARELTADRLHRPDRPPRPGTRSRPHPAPVRSVLCLGPGTAELRALRAGADDWAPLPVRYHVLLERVRALLRRMRPRPGRVRLGALELDPTTRSVHVGERPVALSNYEFALLTQLASDPTRVWASRSSCATSGATGPPRGRGRSTRTSAGYAPNWRPRAGSGS